MACLCCIGCAVSVCSHWETNEHQPLPALLAIWKHLAIPSLAQDLNRKHLCWRTPSLVSSGLLGLVEIQAAQPYKYPPAPRITFSPTNASCLHPKRFRPGQEPRLPCRRTRFGTGFEATLSGGNFRATCSASPPLRKTPVFSLPSSPVFAFGTFSNPCYLLSPFPTHSGASACLLPRRPPALPSPKAMKKEFFKVAWRSAGDPATISSLPRANHPYFRSIVASQLATSWNDLQLPPSSTNLFARFIEWIAAQHVRSPDHQKLQALFGAWKEYQAAKLQAKVSRAILVEQLRFNFGRSKRLEFIASLPATNLPELLEPYPPRGFWWYESERARSRWKATLSQGKQADTRKKRHPLHKIQPELLQHTVSANSDAVIRDAHGGELVLMVVRGFCRDSGVLDWVDGVVREVVAQKRSVRVRDSLVGSVGQAEL